MSRGDPDSSMSSYRKIFNDTTQENFIFIQRFESYMKTNFPGLLGPSEKNAQR